MYVSVEDSSVSQDTTGNYWQLKAKKSSQPSWVSIGMSLSRTECGIPLTRGIVSHDLCKTEVNTEFLCPWNSNDTYLTDFQSHINDDDDNDTSFIGVVLHIRAKGKKDTFANARADLS